MVSATAYISSNRCTNCMFMLQRDVTIILIGSENALTNVVQNIALER